MPFRTAARRLAKPLTEKNASRSFGLQVQAPPDFVNDVHDVSEYLLGDQSDFTVAFLAAERQGQVVQSDAPVPHVDAEPQTAEQIAQTLCLLAGKAAEKVKKIFNDTKRYVVLFIHIDVSGKYNITGSVFLSG